MCHSVFVCRGQGVLCPCVRVFVCVCTASVCVFVSVCVRAYLCICERLQQKLEIDFSHGHHLCHSTAGQGQAVCTQEYIC